MHRATCFALALFPFVHAAEAATYKVGSDGAPACTHTTLQAAINAAQANPGPDTIIATRSASYTQSALVINTDQVLTITGGFASCVTDFSDTQYTVIDGAGGSNQSTFRISGGASSVVNLRYLIVRNGDPSIIDGNGGNINFNGAGVLEINDASISNGLAVKGGGIYANGTNEDARLILGANVGVTGNTARGDGGGVFVNGMVFEMNQPNSVIAFNEALGDPGFSGYGGGLAIRSTGSRSGRGYVSGGGIGSTGAIYSNEAKRGGGVAVSAGDDSSDEARLYLYTTDPARPAAIRENFASEMGGAIYVWPNRSAFDEGFASASLWNAEITGNAAPEGAAVYLDESDISQNLPLGGFLSLNSTNFPSPPPGTAPCPTGAYCGRITGNIAEDAAGVDSNGALVKMDPGADLQGRGYLIADNSVGRIVDLSDSDEFAEVTLELGDSAIVDNNVRQQLIRGDGNARVRIADSTIAGNVIGAPQVIAASRGNVVLRRSIIAQPGKLSLSTGSGTPIVERVIASENATIGGAPEAIVVPPRFLDPARGDYRLRAASPAVDYVPGIAGDDRDAFNLPRDQRLGFLPRGDSQVRDIGAFERAALQPFVLNGELEGDTNLWFLPVGHVAAYSNDNAPGSTAGSGSVSVSGQSSAGRLLGLAQCIEVPGPGTYNLRGWGHSLGNAAQWNRTALIWELRYDGGAGCIEGTIDAGGELTLGTTDQWTASPDAATIVVPASAWNLQTSLTLILAVYPNASNDQYNGWFDRIVLAPGSGADLFKDGFE